MRAVLFFDELDFAFLFLSSVLRLSSMTSPESAFSIVLLFFSTMLCYNSLILAALLFAIGENFICLAAYLCICIKLDIMRTQDQLWESGICAA